MVFAEAYRSLLCEALEARVERNPRYSQRAFARDLGLAPHRMSEILRGRQGLSRDRAELVARRLEWDKAVRSEFCDLVTAVHGRSSAARTAAARRLDKRAPRTSPATKLETSRFKAIGEWHHLALLEVLKVAGSEARPSELAARLELPVAQVRAALGRLIELGLVERKAKGYAVLSDSIVGGDVPSAAIRGYHSQHLDKAKDALVLQPTETRDFNSLVVALDRRRLPELKHRLGQVVEELNAEFGTTAAPDAVYSILVHGFRLDKDPPHAGKEHDR